MFLFLESLGFLDIKTIHKKLADLARFLIKDSKPYSNIYVLQLYNKI